MSLQPWLQPLWQATMARRAQLPHAILLAGAPGSGKRQFAEALAKALLCSAPDGEGAACGECPACKWFEAANHPDMYRMIPESDEEEDDSEAEATGKEKRKSDQIKIEQVRAMQSLLEVGGHQGGRRIVLIDPAEAMNPAAANAVLKSLEEPPAGTVFLLVSHAPRRLLPTIRSRCQVLDFPVPDAQVAAQWLREQGVQEPDALLGFASGLPIAALEFAAGAQRDARKRFADDMLALPKSDPLKLAAQWESWLKSKDGEKAGVSMSVLIGWLQRWLADGARLAAGNHARFFKDYERGLQALVLGRSERWISCYNELLAYRRVAQHPLNARLFLEDVLMRVARATSRG